MIQTKILNIKGTWNEVLNDCRFTANKADLEKEPSDQFKKKILISEHTPIRNITIKWEWISIPTWVSVHWVRHKWEKYVRTQRTDRTGIDRHGLSQDAPVDMRGEANTQALIDTMRKRLCFMASKETRESAESLKLEVTAHDEFIGDVFVPNCIYRCGCPEEKPCGFFEQYRMSFPDDKNIFDLHDRYAVYNAQFKNKHK